MESERKPSEEDLIPVSDAFAKAISQIYGLSPWPEGAKFSAVSVGGWEYHGTNKEVKQ